MTPTPVRPRQAPAVPLRDLIDLVAAELIEPPDHDVAGVTVSGVSQDSRAVQPADLYLARPGQSVHGARFATAAASAGAVAALTDPAGATSCRDAGLPTLVAADPAHLAVRLAHAVYGQPTEGLGLFGVTGTNGKTTTVFLLDAALRALGHATGLIGTIMVRIGADAYPSTRTTPEATDLAGVFAAMRERGCDACSMEVSSHALHHGRVDGIVFDVACFLNLSREHLDQHGDMETYFAVKAGLFTPARARRAVIDVDTEWGRRLAHQARDAGLPVTTLSGTGGTDADAVVRDARIAGAGARGWLVLPDGTSTELQVHMPGAFNLANAAAAATIVWTLGADVAVAASGIAGEVVPGHMEPVGPPGSVPTAFVDFAHTPEAVAQALAAARERVTGKVIAVGGCGGDRDPGKRAPMGAAMASGADVVIVTDDNPRTEDPAAIRAAVRAGATRARFEAEVRDIGDRADAIAVALAAAGPADAVVVLGKGHETGQEIAGVVHPFDDRAQVLAWQAAHPKAVDPS